VVKLKVSKSFSLEPETIELINKNPNPSGVINDILLEKLASIDWKKRMIKQYQAKIKELKAQIDAQINEKSNFLDNIPQEIITFLSPKEEIHNGISTKSGGIKAILAVDPSRIHIWTGVVNKRFGKRYTPYQLEQIIVRWL